MPTFRIDVTILAGHPVTVSSGQTGFVKSLILNGILINGDLLKMKQQ